MKVGHLLSLAVPFKLLGKSNNENTFPQVLLNLTSAESGNKALYNLTKLFQINVVCRGVTVFHVE